jgi:hypothetical protein
MTEEELNDYNVEMSRRLKYFELIMTLVGVIILNVLCILGVRYY